MVWDHDEAADAGVDLPLGQAFGLVEGAGPYQSLLVGQRDGAWYNRFPMPYHRQAIVRIDTEKPLKGTIRVRTLRGVAPDAAFFHSVQRQSIPTRTGEDFTWLKEEGRGHFAGVLLMTEGKAKLPYWLEGDDRFKVDGRLAIHGTGTEDYFNCGWYALQGRLDRAGHLRGPRLSRLPQPGRHLAGRRVSLAPERPGSLRAHHRGGNRAWRR